MSGELVHATLQRLTRKVVTGKDAAPRVEADGDPCPVQLNPATLKLSRRNNVDRGGTSTGTQKAQYPSQEGATLAFDLEFDTSEQEVGGQHVDVRRWTALVRQFVEPPVDRPADPPPAVQFTWGTLVFNGIVEQVTEDLDLFAKDGTPLHAKVSVSIAEQNFAYETMAQGPATRTAKTATEPGARPGTAPGASGTGAPETVVKALAGESAQQLLARIGQDPAAWRGAMRDLTSPLGLAAGAEIQLGAEVREGLTPGIGTAGGQFNAAPNLGTPTTLESVLGLPGGSGATTGQAGEVSSPGVPTLAQAGFALSSAGGVAAAEHRVVSAATAAASRSASGFAPPARLSPLAGRAIDTGEPVDPRTRSYGRGVPLQLRAQVATAVQAQAGGSPAVRARAGRDEVPAADATRPPWESLRARESCDAPVTPARAHWRPGGTCR